MEAPLKLGDRAGTTVQPFQWSQDAWLEKQPLLCASCDSPCTVCTEPIFPPLPSEKGTLPAGKLLQEGRGQGQLTSFISTLEPRPFPGDLQCLISPWDRGVLCKSNLSWFVNPCQCLLSPQSKASWNSVETLAQDLSPPSPASHFDETILGWGWP